MNRDKLKKIPIEEAIIPKNNYTVYVDKYWVIDDNCILFWGDFAPQCNSDKELCAIVRDKIYPDCEIRQLKVVYHKSIN